MFQDDSLLGNESFEGQDTVPLASPIQPQAIRLEGMGRGDSPVSLSRDEDMVSLRDSVANLSSKVEIMAEGFATMQKLLVQHLVKPAVYRQKRCRKESYWLTL